MEFNGSVKRSWIHLFGAAAASARRRTRLAPNVDAQAHSLPWFTREFRVGSSPPLFRPVVGALISRHVNSLWIWSLTLPRERGVGAVVSGSV